MQVIRIGTRGSALARAQVDEVIAALVASSGLGPEDCVPVVISTQGDRVTDRPIRDLGGKGVFCSEIETALLAGEIDLAVHSLKDMPSRQPDGLIIDCVLPRADPRDALVCTPVGAIAALSSGVRVGTSSLRRRWQLQTLNPALAIEEIRGNLSTRIDKCQRGRGDCLVLAMAGLVRLGIGTVPIHPIPIEQMIPAPAQGILGLERRVDDERIAALIAPLNDSGTLACAIAERTVLARLGANCNVPLAAHACRQDGDGLDLKAQLFGADGRHVGVVTVTGSLADPVGLGQQAADDLLALRDAH